MIKHIILELGENVGQTIIFVGMGNSDGILHEALVDIGYAVTNLQSDVSPEDRFKMVQEFKDN